MNPLPVTHGTGALRDTMVSGRPNDPGDPLETLVNQLSRGSKSEGPLTDQVGPSTTRSGKPFREIVKSPVPIQSSRRPLALQAQSASGPRPQSPASSTTSSIRRRQLPTPPVRPVPFPVSEESGQSFFSSLGDFNDDEIELPGPASKAHSAGTPKPRTLSYPSQTVRRRPVSSQGADQPDDSPSSSSSESDDPAPPRRDQVRAPRQVDAFAARAAHDKLDIRGIVTGITQFSGFSSSSVVTDWIEAFEQLCIDLNVPDPVRAFPYVCNKSVLQQLKATHRKFLNQPWDRVSALLLKTYGEQDNSLEYQERLLSLRQGSQRVQEHAAVFAEVAARAGVSLKSVVGIFVNSLRSDVNVMLGLDPPSTWLEAVSQAVHAESRLLAVKPSPSGLSRIIQPSSLQSSLQSGTATQHGGGVATVKPATGKFHRRTSQFSNRKQFSGAPKSGSVPNSSLHRQSTHGSTLTQAPRKLLCAMHGPCGHTTQDCRALRNKKQGFSAAIGDDNFICDGKADGQHARIILDSASTPSLVAHRSLSADQLAKADQSSTKFTDAVSRTFATIGSVVIQVEICGQAYPVKCEIVSQLCDSTADLLLGTSELARFDVCIYAKEHRVTVAGLPCPLVRASPVGVAAVNAAAHELVTIGSSI